MKRILILFLLIAKIDSRESLNTISIVGQDRGAAGQVAYEDGHGTLVPLIKHLKLTLQKSYQSLLCDVDTISGTLALG